MPAESYRPTQLIGEFGPPPKAPQLWHQLVRSMLPEEYSLIVAKAPVFATSEYPLPINNDSGEPYLIRLASVQEQLPNFYKLKPGLYVFTDFPFPEVHPLLAEKTRQLIAIQTGLLLLEAAAPNIQPRIILKITYKDALGVISTDVDLIIPLDFTPDLVPSGRIPSHDLLSPNLYVFEAVPNTIDGACAQISDHL